MARPEGDVAAKNEVAVSSQPAAAKTPVRSTRQPLRQPSHAASASNGSGFPQPHPEASEPLRFPGAPLPTSLYNALGTRWSGQWLFALVAASIVTIAGYWVLDSAGHDTLRGLAVIVGAVIGFFVLAAMSAASGTISRSDQAYPAEYRELYERCRQAWTRLRKLDLSPEHNQVREDLLGVAAALKRDGQQWLDGSGYLRTWRDLHTAEEDLIRIDSEAEVAACGFEDLLRLAQSDMPTSEQLQAEIKAAIPHLAPNAGGNFVPPVAYPEPADPDTARLRIRSVRIAINDDREDKWHQILRARNGLLLTGMITYFIEFVLLLTAVADGVHVRVLVSAIAFWAIGALASATHQWFARTSAQRESEDFGFANANMICAPLISGLVAVLAVAIVAQVHFSIAGQEFGASLTSWPATFDWNRNPAAIFLAALFGLTPSLLFNWLQSEANGVLESLKASEPTGGKGAK